MTRQPIDEVIDEYRKYAGEKARDLDVKYITEFDHHAMFVRLNDKVYQKVRDEGTVLTPPASDKNGEGPDIQTLDEAAMELHRLNVRDEATSADPKPEGTVTEHIRE